MATENKVEIKVLTMDNFRSSIHRRYSFDEQAFRALTFSLDYKLMNTRLNTMTITNKEKFKTEILCQRSLM